MRTLGIIVVLVACVIGGAFAWSSVNYPTYTYRYRMTVEVEVGGQIKSNSSVIEIVGRSQPPIGAAPPIYHFVHGVAVFVDLGNGRNVVATLAFGPNGAADLLYSVAPRVFKMPTEEIATKLVNTNARADLPESLVPTLVTFADLNDPQSARVVRPDEFEQVFGPGVHFKRAWIEMTNDPVTRGIEKRVTWVGNYDAETTFERRLRETGGSGGGSLTPGRNLRRGP